MPADAPTGYALITGASSGIGEAFAREYARRGVPLVLTARRLDRLEKLAAELRSQVPVEVIPADLSNPLASAGLVAEIERRGLTLRILVNNAGYGVPGRYLTKDWQVHAQFLQVMIASTSELTWRVLPALRASGNGRIINVASFAALVPGADGQTLYAPAKAYLVKFSESLSLENADRSVKVTALCPGFTWSEFHDVTGTRAMMSKLPKWAWLQADDVAKAGIDGVERGHVLVVPGRVYRMGYFIAKLLPSRLMLGLMGRNSRKIRQID
jgi:short-subunit dehydrogenase